MMYRLGQPGAPGNPRLPEPVVPLTRCLPSQMQVGFHSIS